MFTSTTTPACYRYVRRRGLLPCCLESIDHCGRLTTVGSKLQCRICEAVLQVDEAGAWSWTGEQGTILPEPHPVVSRSHSPSSSSR